VIQNVVNGPLRVAVITNIPAPYRQKQWEHYATIRNVSLTVFYCGKREQDRFWDVQPASGVTEVFLRGISYRKWHFNPSIFLVPFQKFDLFLVGGYGFPTVMIAILLLKLFNKNWTMMIDGIAPPRLKSEKWYVRAVQRFFTKGANAYLVNGTSAKKWLNQFGIAGKKVFNQFLTVDVSYFTENEKASRERRSLIRNRYAISEDAAVVMYVGRLVRHKGISDLIHATENLIENKNYRVTALIVGEGEQRDSLELETKNLYGQVVFTGQIPLSDLRLCYYASDIFVLPTHYDPWGLVINEAMACALPVITTNAAGASLDLIKNNGYVIRPGDVHSLSSAIEALMDAKLRKAFGEESRRIISKWTYKESLESFENMLRYLNNERMPT
jgi:glycosyltransferase involved in cell wall biosynthesis